MMKKVYFDLSESDKELINQVKPLLQSKDFEIANLGLKMFKAHKVWKNLKSRSLWISTNSYWKDMTKMHCFNVADIMSINYFRTWYCCVFDRLENHKYFLRWIDDK